MSYAKLFLQRLEKMAILDDKVIAHLRTLMAEAKGNVTAEALAKVLVDHGHLTVFQAKKVINDLMAEMEDRAKPELTLLEEEDLTAPPPPPPKPAPIVVKPKPSPPATPKSSSKWTTTKKATAQGPPAPPDAAQAPALVEIGNDDLLNDPLLDGSSPLAVDNPLLGPPKSRSVLPSLLGGGKSKNPWDSMLLYVGGGALALLMLAFVVLYLSLARGSAHEAFQLAEDDYRAQAYRQAIGKFERYLRSYSKDENASLARVRIGISQIRLAMDEGSDLPQTLATTKQTLERIENEEKFSEARADLVDMLPTLAAALASQARQATTDVPKATEYVALAEQALGLVNDGAYIPPSLRGPVEAKVNAITEEVAFVKREINRDTELKAALVAITNETESNNTAAAYEVRRQLLRKYPGLDVNADLRAATLAISSKDRELVKVTAETMAPSAPPTSPVTEYVFADRSGNDAPGVAGQRMAFTLTGAVYAADATSGRIVWRHVTGAGNTRQPVPIDPDLRGDWLVCDEANASLQRLRGNDGQVLWNLSIPGPIFAPVIVGEHTLVATEHGILFDVATADGQSTRRVTLPQPLAQSPAYAVGKPFLYQLGDHSNLYVLAADTLECRETYFVGHPVGSIAVSPVVVAGQVIVAENAGTDHAWLHLLSADTEGLNLTKKQEPIRLAGHVVAPPAVDGRRICFVTDRGAMYVLDVDPANTSQPVSVVARQTPSRKEPVITYAVAADNKAWTADESLTLVEVQPAKGELAWRWSQWKGDTFVAPVIKRGGALLHARRKRGAGELVIAASSASDGKTYWQTTVGTPVVALQPSSGKVAAVNAAGAVYGLGQAGVVDSPVIRPPVGGDMPPFTHAVEVDEHHLLLVNDQGAAQWCWIDRQANKSSLVRFASRNAKLNSTPVLFAGELLVPLTNGQLIQANPSTGDAVGLPFQPRQEVDSLPSWRCPLVLSGAPPRVVVATNRRELFMVEQDSAPQPHLEAKRQAETPGDIGARLAQLGEQLLGVVQAEQGIVLQAFGLPDLQSEKSLPLSGLPYYGPQQVQDVVLLATDSEGLLCIASGPELRWKLSLAGAALVGDPVPYDGDFVFVTTAGDAWRVSGQDGAIRQRVTTGRMPAGTPRVFDDRLFIPGFDGAVYVLPLSKLQN